MRKLKLQETEQLFFPFDESFNPVAPTTRSERVLELENNGIPEYLMTLGKEALTLEECLKRIGVEEILFPWGLSYVSATFTNNRVVRGGHIGKNSLVLNIEKKIREEITCSATLLYFDRKGQVWKANATFHFDQALKPETKYWRCDCGNQAYCTHYSIEEFARVKTTRLITGCYFVQKDVELIDIMARKNPYLLDWAIKSDIDPKCLLLAPQLEILIKAGYIFANKFRHYNRLNENDCVFFNRLCQQGTNPKDIFKTPKAVYSVLKNENDLEIWDSFRKMMKLGKIGIDTIQQAYDLRFSRKDLESINGILAKKYDGKPVFTWNSLMQYLVRLDTFEAIDKQEAFHLLNDYLNMCNQLRMQPRVDGDSLKREHDIAARNCRNKRNEIMSEMMKQNCEEMKKYDYSEGVYFIRGIRNHDDLLDEANQQHNCVASYGSSIANGTSYIYVMREVAHPEKSLVTIELSPNGKTIRQKYLAYNQPIRNKSQSEFLDRWMKYCKAI